MKKVGTFILMALVSGGFVSAKEQTDTLSAVKPDSIQLAFTKYIQQFQTNYNQSLERWDDLYLLITGIKSDPDYYKFAMPATYYRAPIEEAMSINSWHPSIPFIKKETWRDSLDQVPNLERSKRIDDYINRQLLSFYVQYPNLVHQNQTVLDSLEPLANKYQVKEPKKEEMVKMLTINNGVDQVSESDLVVFKPNFWTISGNGFLQFAQNYISENWYKGGESTKAMSAGLTWQANYDDREHIQFENKVEWKLGFVTAPSDTMHSYKPNMDMIRLTTKFGYKAIKNWYYTVSADFKTQLFSNYENNSDNLVSTFLSPLELNVGVGMDYKFVKNNVCNLSVLINPLNYALYAVRSERVNPARFNISEGRVEGKLGSRLESTLKWKVIPKLVWESRFSYSTNYKQVVGEWENTFTFVFNKYWSTRLYAFGRYDDGVAKDPDESYFQLQEQLSFGLNYTW